MARVLDHGNHQPAAPATGSTLRWVRSRRYRGCRPAATPRPFRLRPLPAGTAPGRRVLRSSRSSSSPRRSGGRAVPWATTLPLLWGASVQRGTENLMHGLHEQLAVLIRQAAQIDQETRRANILHSPAPRSATSAYIESYALPSGTPSPGRAGYLFSCETQYSSASRCSSALSARYSSRGHHDRLNLARPEDHLMISDLVIKRQGTLTHAHDSTPRRNAGPHPS